MYYDDALFEQAEAYMKAEQIVKASENYTIIVSNYKSSSYIKKSLLQLAFIEYNKQNLDEALLMYQRVLQQYPGSQESQTALNMIRNIYKKKNDIDGFSNYVKQIGGHANVTEAQLDSLSFEVAQELYLDGECDKALPLLSAYIQKYGEGFFCYMLIFIVQNVSFLKAMNLKLYQIMNTYCSYKIRLPNLL